MIRNFHADTITHTVTALLNITMSFEYFMAFTFVHIVLTSIKAAELKQDIMHEKSEEEHDADDDNEEKTVQYITARNRCVSA